MRNDILHQVSILRELTFVQGTVAAPLALRPEIALRNERIADAQLPLVHAFNAPLFSGEQHFPRPEQGREWRLMPLDEDPLFCRPEGFPFPREILRRLDQMERAGVDFDSFYVAHELPLQAAARGERTPLSLLEPPPPHQAVAASAQMGTWAGQVQQFTSMLFLGTFATLAAGAVVAGALATVGSVAAVGSLALLDPILFGVVADPKQPFRPGTIAAWYYIGHWVYA